MNKQETDQLFKTLYHAHYPQLERYCRAMTPNVEAAKELVLETVYQAYLNFGKLKDTGKFKSYVFGISSNLFKKWLRDKKDHDNLDHLPADYNFSINEEKSEIQVLYWALEQLEDYKREIITLFELSRFKLNEIAEMKQMPVNTVKTHLSRARNELKDILIKQEKHLKYER